MVGVLVFSQKPSDGPYKKTPRKVLEDDDIEVLRNYHFSTSYFFHWIDDDDIAKMPDKDFIEYANSKNETQIVLSSRKSGKGYSTEDKKSFVRIIHQSRNVFSSLTR